MYNSRKLGGRAPDGEVGPKYKEDEAIIHSLIL